MVSCISRTRDFWPKTLAKRCGLYTSLYGILLSPTLWQIQVCWPVRPWFFQDFLSMPSTRLMLYNRSAVLLLALPFSGDSVALSTVALGPFNFAFKRDGGSGGQHASSAHPNFHHCVCADNLTAHSPAWLFPLLPALFSRVVFQLCIGFHQLTFLSCRYVEIAAFFCVMVSSFSTVYTIPDLCLAHLARSMEAPIMASHVFSCFTSHGKSLDRVVHQAFMFGPSHAPIPAKVNY